MGAQKPAFIGHGSPMNVIAENAYTQFLRRYGQCIGRPEAIVVISAHWLTEGTYVTGNERPRQVRDFWGFPEALYEVEYRPRGSPKIAGLIESSGLGIKVDHGRGIDHAAWAILRHAVPDADVPVLEMSLDAGKSAREHYELGKRLSGLRDRGILFIGSGNLVHNLGDIAYDLEDKPFEWALRADEWLGDALRRGDVGALVDYERHMPDYRRSIPTDEHYVPLLYVLGMKTDAGGIVTLHEGIQNGSVSMRCVEVD